MNDFYSYNDKRINIENDKKLSFLYGITMVNLTGSPYLFKFYNINFKFLGLGQISVIGLYLLTFIFSFTFNLDSIENNILLGLLFLISIFPVILVLLLNKYAFKILNSLKEETK